jgi:sugar diacid utilization regulator
VPSTALLPKALREAELALAVADAGQRVVEYSKIPLRTLLLHLAEGNVQSAMPAWTAALRAADQKSRGTLIATLRAYADADMNVLKASKRLKVHANTIYARMEKIRDVTALDPLRYHGLNEMLLAVDCMQTDP